MDFNIEVRKKQLDNLDQVIASSKSRIQSVLDYLGWTTAKVEEDDPLVSCPIDPSHRISPESWKTHVEKCSIKREGYDLNERFLSESLNSPTQTVYLDRNKKIEIITKELAETKDFRLAWNGLDPDPRTSDRMFSTYSTDERLAFYNYSVENTAGPPVPPEFTTIHKKDKEDKPLTYEELLAQERDAKRRRAKYKSVHINKKNHTEVIREVINGQMEEYKEWLSEKEKRHEHSNDIKADVKEKGEDVERPHSSISKNSTHSGSSRSTSRRHDNHRRDRSRERPRRSRERDRGRRDDKRRRASPRRRSSDDRRHRNHSSERGSSKERRSRHDRDHERRH